MPALSHMSPVFKASGGGRKYSSHAGALTHVSGLQGARPAARGSLKCQAAAQKDSFWQRAQAAGAGAALSAALLLGTPSSPALAELNKFEFNAGGEFGTGTAAQYGEADIKGRDFSNQDLQRSNFTSADCRDCNFKNSKLQGAYFIKTVVARANFEGADLSDVLMDRAVLVQANLRGTVMQRTVLTRSDLTGADVFGTDFTNSLLDRSQQLALCKYADGTNPTTGEETRKSLGCGSRRAFRASSPSSPDGPQVSEEEKAAFTKSMPSYGKQ